MGADKGDLNNELAPCLTGKKEVGILDGFGGCLGNMLFIPGRTTAGEVFKQKTTAMIRVSRGCPGSQVAQLTGLLELVILINLVHL